MSIRSEEDKIFSTLRLAHPAAVADGVVHEPEFLSTRYRIVYILKEVNGGSGWDLRDFVYDGGRPQTWDNIARWTEGILSLENEIPWTELEKGNEQRRGEFLKKIAVVNLKKIPGGHTSDGKTIYDAALDNGEIIKK